MRRRLWELLAQSYFVKLLTRNRKLGWTCSDPDLSIRTKPLRFPFVAQKKMMGLYFVKMPLTQNFSRNCAKQSHSSEVKKFLFEFGWRIDPGTVCVF